MIAHIQDNIVPYYIFTLT